MPAVQRAPQGRIVNVSSIAHMQVTGIDWSVLERRTVVGHGGTEALVSRYPRDAAVYAVIRSRGIGSPGSLVHVPLLRGLHTFWRGEVQNRIASRAERRALIRSGKEALAVHGGSRADTAFEQDDEAGEILVLAAESVEDPRAQAGTAG